MQDQALLGRAGLAIPMAKAASTFTLRRSAARGSRSARRVPGPSGMRKCADDGRQGGASVRARTVDASARVLLALRNGRPVTISYRDQSHSWGTVHRHPGKRLRAGRPGRQARFLPPPPPPKGGSCSTAEAVRVELDRVIANGCFTSPPAHTRFRFFLVFFDATIDGWVGTRNNRCGAMADSVRSRPDTRTEKRQMASSRQSLASPPWAANAKAMRTGSPW